MNQTGIAEIYRNNMRQLKRGLVPTFSTVIFGFACMFIFIIYGLKVFFIGLPIILIGGLGILRVYHKFARCPACRYLPPNKTRTAIGIDLEVCPKCGVKLTKDQTDSCVIKT